MVNEGGIQRVFLGVAAPALVSAVEYVLPRYRRRDTLDLNGLVVVFPGARAGRRFRELLLRWAAQHDLRMLPPQVVTVGRLPELLYRPQKPFASDWVQQQAWADAVRSVPEDIRTHVMPRVAGAAGPQSDWTTGDWLAAGRLLQRQYRELAAEGFSFSDVARDGATLPQFPERERWKAMGTIQAHYLCALDELGLWDRQTARLVAVKRQECHLDRDVLLLGTVDLGRNLRQMLRQVAARVTALIYAPSQWQARFDAFGCVDVSAWQQAHLEIDKTQFAIVDKPLDQAVAVADYLAGQAVQFTVDEVTVGCADERLVTPVQRALQRRGTPSRWGPGRQLAESLPYRLLDAIRRWLAVDDAAAFASVARHPDVVTWLAQHGIRFGWLRELDQFRAKHVPLRVTPQTVRSQKSELIRAVRTLADLRKPLEGPPALPAIWSERIVALLQQVYGQRTYDRDAPEDQMTVRSCLRLREFLAEQLLLPSRLAVECTAEQALQIVLQKLRTERVPAATNPEAIEILGWLELPLDDAPLLVVAGVNEGVVPKSVTADLFLPDRLRQHLDIDDNRRRYARDAYALSVLAVSSRQLYLVAGRHDEDDSPLFPSRLLFAAGDEEVAHRWNWYFQRAADAALPVAGQDAATESEENFAFTIPRPDRHRDQLQRLRVTHFRSYLACPYRFYLEHVLKLKTVTDDVSELDALQFGTVMHAALDAFGRGPAKDSTDAEEITAALHAALNQIISELCGLAVPAAIRIQIEQMRLRLKAFAQRQAEHARDGWRIEFVEAPGSDVHAVITVPEGSMKITGRMDRIDRHVDTGTRAIWDYKTGESGNDPRAAHQSHAQWIDLQLPLYINLAGAMNLTGPFTLGYINLSQRVDEIGFASADWSAPELASAQRAAECVVSKILRREFWPPADPPPPFAADWSALCLDGVLERKSSPAWEAQAIQGELFERYS